MCQLVLFQNCSLWWLLVSEGWGFPLPASTTGPAACGKSHHKQAEVAKAVLGLKQMLLSPAPVWPSMPGETDLLELKEMDQRSCRDSRHRLVKGDSGFCPAFNADSCRSVL